MFTCVLAGGCLNSLGSSAANEIICLLMWETQFQSLSLRSTGRNGYHSNIALENPLDSEEPGHVKSVTGCRNS